ncbi:MAG: DUF4197 domain-containing protein [Bacteroidales bacterium]|jgi:hypothetical protein|nr:DUF4197 domain-containing protein [Bacteroidales bacterium]
MKKFNLLLITILLIFSQEIKAQFFDEVMKAISPVQGGLTESDAVEGIKEALIKGTGESVSVVSKLNGYFGNPEIKIPFPQEARTIESKLRALGLDSQVDEVILSINRAAEDAAKEAGPIFVAAIRNMTISDAIQIVKGSNDAATRYLDRTTSPALKAKFGPVIKASLARVDATRLWTDVINTYNQIPFVTRMDPDLAGYVTDKAIAGLFTMIAKEELKIRKDPVARTTEILKKVFGG